MGIDWDKVEAMNAPRRPKGGRVRARMAREVRKALEHLGWASESDLVMDTNADPNCPDCKGTGAVYTPERLRGGHVCPCTLETRKGDSHEPEGTKAQERDN